MLGRERDILSFVRESESFFPQVSPYTNILPLPIVGKEGSNSPVSAMVRVRVTTSILGLALLWGGGLKTVVTLV